VLAQHIWEGVAEVSGYDIRPNFEYIATRWLCNKRHLVFNMIASAMMWSIWKMRNFLCFQKGTWRQANMADGGCHILQLENSLSIEACPRIDYAVEKFNMMLSCCNTPL
jgi:hypothetical protein